MKNVMASLRCYGDSNCKKTQIIRKFHLYNYNTAVVTFFPYLYSRRQSSNLGGIPPKKSSRATLICTFQEQSSYIDTRRTNVHHIGSGRQVVQFLRIFWRTKVDLSKKNYTTFISSSWVIFEKLVIFWTMCHHSLCHENRALLSI